MGSTADEKLCAICNKVPGKYKCGKCTIPFCSVPCSQTHRTQCIPLPKPAPRPPSPPPAPKSKSRNPFTALDSSPELSLLFQRYPNLPSLLLSIDAAMQPPTLSQQAAAQAAAATAQASSSNGRRGGRRGGGGGGGGGGGSIPRYEKWNHDVSLHKGKEALRRARNLDGKDGEAVREYQALVLKLVGGDHAAAAAGGFGGMGTGSSAVVRGQTTTGQTGVPQNQHGAEEDEEDGPDVADLLRQQLEEEDARLIKDLLRAEKALS